MTGRHRIVARKEGGWVGILALLIVVCIVAVLSSTSLKTLLPGGKSTADKSASRVPARGAGGGLGPADADITTSAPPPSNAIDRARSVQDIVNQQPGNLGSRIGAQDR